MKKRSESGGLRCGECGRALDGPRIYRLAELQAFDFDAVPIEACEACAFETWALARRAA